jgi:hypothetical protein
MRTIATLLTCLALSVAVGVADAAEPEGRARVEPPVETTGDLFPGAGRVTVSAASGLPFLGIGEVGLGVTNGFALGVIGGVTPSVLTAGLRPRLCVATGRRTSLMLVVPMLYYPQASAPGPGNVGSTSWVLARPEIFFEDALNERWQVAFGMGIIAAASTEALGQLAAGRPFAVPAYDGASDTKRGFAGGVWNTVSARGSFATSRRTHLFAEASLVMAGVVPAENVGGPPVVVTVGVQHAF